MKHTPLAPTLAFVVVAASLMACSADMTMPEEDVPQFAKGGGPGGSKTAPSVIAMSGDLGPLVTAGGEPVTAALGKNPFKNLTLSDVRITIGQEPALVGDGQRCRELMPNRTVVPTGTDTEWDNAVRGDWVGELTIWQGRTSSQSNMKFAGTRSDGTAVQFTSNSDNAEQTTVGTTTTLRFIDAPLGFGDGPGRVVPRDDNGLPIIYCVNVKITAEQVEQ
jgi:hypothetical protein